MVISFPATIEQRLMRLFEQLERIEYKPVGRFHWFGM